MKLQLGETYNFSTCRLADISRIKAMCTFDIQRPSCVWNIRSGEFSLSCIHRCVSSVFVLQHDRHCLLSSMYVEVCLIELRASSVVW